MLSKKELRAIVVDDQARRDARDIADYVALHHPRAVAPGVDPYHVSRGITGVPSNHGRTYRASKDSWSFGLANPRLGWALDDNGALIDSDVPLVRVTRDGATSIVPASTFNRTRRPRNTKTATAQRHTRTNETARIAVSQRDAAAIADGTA